MRRWLVAAAMLLLGRRRRRPTTGPDRRIVAPGAPDPRAELILVLLLLAAAVFAAGFIAAYAVGRVPHRTQFLGLGLGLSFACLAAGCTVAAKRLVVTEELEEEYAPPENVTDQESIAEIVDESGSRLTRRRLVKLAAGAAGGTLGAALIVPAVSLGPILDTSSFYETPWRRGRRLVDEGGRPFRAADIEEQTFYAAFPEGAEREDFGAPLVVVRLKPDQLQLPRRRDDWAPHGILAFSKICTHAGCAISLYRAPLFPQASPSAALVCPCHYSTFDPATGGEVIYGPAGRPLPQLPLMIDGRGVLRAAGVFSGPVGPSWWGVRMKGARSR
jgi:ubiquinol-cytochrome c reductase iron-sulfur subunit